MRNLTQTRIGTSLRSAALSLLLLAGSARATTGTFTYTASLPDMLTDWSHGFSLPQFNPSLGSLDSIQFSITYDIKTSATLNNTSADTTEVRLQAGSQFSLTIPNQASQLELSLSAPQGDYALAPGALGSYGMYSLAQTTTLTLTGDQMNAFVGTGSLLFSGHTTGWEAITMRGGDANITLSTLAGANLTLTYTDTLAVVPEPSVAALLLLGLGSLASARHREGRAA